MPEDAATFAGVLVRVAAGGHAKFKDWVLARSKRQECLGCWAVGEKREPLCRGGLFQMKDAATLSGFFDFFISLDVVDVKALEEFVIKCLSIDEVGTHVNTTQTIVGTKIASGGQEPSDTARPSFAR